MKIERTDQNLAEFYGWEPLPEGMFHPDNPVGQTPPYLGVVPLLQYIANPKGYIQSLSDEEDLTDEMKTWAKSRARHILKQIGVAYEDS
jgi:hypothetical protein